MATISSLSFTYNVNNTRPASAVAARNAQQASTEKADAEKAGAEKAANAQAKTAQATTTQTKTETTSKPTVEDQVDLSDSARARQLEQQGESLSSIAAILNVDLSAVDGYLGLTTQNQVEQAKVSVLA